MSIARDGATPGRLPRCTRRIVELRARESHVAIGAAGQQHLASGQERRRLRRAWRGEARGVLKTKGSARAGLYLHQPGSKKKEREAAQRTKCFHNFIGKGQSYRLDIRL